MLYFTQKKYFKNKAFAQAEGKQGSQFWKGIMKSRDSVRWDLAAQVGKGKNILFWEEVWVLDIPLRLEFPSLFNLCKLQKEVVADHWAGDGWRTNCRRPLGSDDMHEWERLMDIFGNVYLSEREDTFTWILEKSGQYSTKSMYRRLSFRGMVNRRMVKLWRNKIPMKIRVFMWLVMQGRLQTGSNLQKKMWR